VSDCVFCDRDFLRGEAEVYLENEHCVYAATRDPRDPADVLPGSGVIVTIAHKASPFDFSVEEWAATHDLLLQAKAVWDDRLAPDGYGLYWSPFPRSDEAVVRMHAHLHVVPRFDDEPNADGGGRVGIKEPQNVRPDPLARGTGRALRFGRRSG
jgi:diadenosine tetraphosphate (Ap4A) HIT family hydrolase